MTDFALLLRDARRTAGLTQRELAEQADIHHTYLSQMENGRSLPSARTTLRLAGILGADPLPLLAARHEPPPELLTLTASQWAALSDWLKGLLTAGERNGTG